jgi:RimJ/RimL family protein N-acetyltransferase
MTPHATAYRRRTQAERAYDVLAGELRALDRDIAAARSKAHASEGGLALPGHRSDGPRARLAGDAVVLADGARILVRPVEPGDEEALGEALERVGALSRYEDLLPDDHGHDRQLVAAEAHDDHRRREALVALDAASGEVVGLARYRRRAADATGVDVAFAVADAWQSRGVGTVLAGRLADRARESGIERFTARALVGNDRARKLLEAVARDVEVTRDGAVVSVRAELGR